MNHINAGFFIFLPRNSSDQFLSARRAASVINKYNNSIFSEFLPPGPPSFFSRGRKIPGILVSPKNPKKCTAVLRDPTTTWIFLSMHPIPAAAAISRRGPRDPTTTWIFLSPPPKSLKSVRRGGRDRGATEEAEKKIRVRRTFVPIHHCRPPKCGPRAYGFRPGKTRRLVPLLLRCAFDYILSNYKIFILHSNHSRLRNDRANLRFPSRPLRRRLPRWIRCT